MRMQKLGIGHLTLGASATLCKYVLLPILQPFVRENPHIQISISCQSSYETIEALEKGSIDIGLIGGPESMRQPQSENGSAPMDRLNFLPAMEIQDIFVTTRSYLDHLKERIPASTHLSSRTVIAESTLMLLNKENMTRQYVDRYLSRENLTASRMIEVTSMDLLIEFAKIDLGIACVIRNFVREETVRR